MGTITKVKPEELRNYYRDLKARVALKATLNKVVVLDTPTATVFEDGTKIFK